MTGKIRVFPPVLALLLLAGCAISHPGDLSLVQTTSDHPRVGNVYFVRGFMGWWSMGLDQLAGSVERAGLRSSVYSGGQWEDLCDRLVEEYQGDPQHEPLVLVGHSYGADEVLEIARRLNDEGIAVDLVVTIDPVTPPKVPGNIKLTLNYYQSNGVWDNVPVWRGVPLEQDDNAKGVLKNMNLRTDRTDLLMEDTTHKSMTHNPLLQKQIVLDILEICPPRQQWVGHPMGRPGGTAAVLVNAPGE